MLEDELETIITLDRESIRIADKLGEKHTEIYDKRVEVINYLDSLYADKQFNDSFEIIKLEERNILKKIFPEIVIWTSRQDNTFTENRVSISKLRFDIQRDILAKMVEYINNFIKEMQGEPTDPFYEPPTLQDWLNKKE